MSVIEPVTNLDCQNDMKSNSTPDIFQPKNPKTVIKVEGLSKKFCRSLKRSMFYGTIDIFRNMFGIPYNQGVLRKNEFWALENINFELKKGETLGIIGVNGSGKSTLLRLITGIFPPDKGKITVKGRIGSLIAVGAGFHPHMTGRENIYLNGTILGMTMVEIKERFDKIVDFADIGEFLDAPVSTYSSGMRVRLGFAVAMHCDPDILLVDEVLSVGDISFRNKSLRYMSNYREKANAIVFVSHNLEQVRILCNRVIVLDKGRIIFDGNTHQGCVIYEELTRGIRLNSFKKEEPIIENYEKRQSSGEEIEFIDIGILDKTGQKTDKIGMNEEIDIYCDFKVKRNLDGLYFSVGVLDEDYKTCIWVMSNDNDKLEFRNIEKGNYRLIVNIPEHHLMPRLYIPNIVIRNDMTGEFYEKVWPKKSSFRVTSENNALERGFIYVKENWELKKI